MLVITDQVGEKEEPVAICENVNTAITFLKPRAMARIKAQFPDLTEQQISERLKISWDSDVICVSSCIEAYVRVEMDDPSFLHLYDVFEPPKV